MLLELALREEPYSCEFAIFEPAFEGTHVRLSMPISLSLRVKAYSGERTGKPVALEKPSSIMFL